MWTVCNSFSNALKCRWSFTWHQYHQAIKKVTFYTCPRLTFLKKNAMENAYKRIFEPLDFKILWGAGGGGACPQTPREACAFSAWNLPRLVLATALLLVITISVSKQNIIGILGNCVYWQMHSRGPSLLVDLALRPQYWMINRGQKSYFSLALN